MSAQLHQFGHQADGHLSRGFRPDIEAHGGANLLQPGLRHPSIPQDPVQLRFLGAGTDHAEVLGLAACSPNRVESFFVIAMARRDDYKVMVLCGADLGDRLCPG